MSTPPPQWTYDGYDRRRDQAIEDRLEEMEQTEWDERWRLANLIGRPERNPA